jgi:hypothetical protein
MLTGIVVAGWSLVAFVFYEELYVPNTVAVRFWWIDDTLRLPIMVVLAVGSFLSFILMRLIVYRLLSQIVAFIIVFSFALLLTSRLTSETNAQRLNSIALNGHAYHLLIASGHNSGTNVFGSPNAILLQCDTLNTGCHIIWNDDLDDLMPWEDPYRDMALYHRDDTVVVSTPQTVFFTYAD